MVLTLFYVFCMDLGTNSDFVLYSIDRLPFYN
jgi:hypothetical protein